MLSHNNVASNVLIAQPRVPAVDPNMDYRVLSFLPVCHIFERMLHYLYMYMGAQIHFGESLETIKEDLNHTQPIMFTAVLACWRNSTTASWPKDVQQAAKSAIFNWVVGVALEWDPNKGGFYQIKLNLARKLVFGKVKKPSASVAFSCGLGLSRPSTPPRPLLQRCWHHGAGRLRPHGDLSVVSMNTTNGANMLKIGSVGKLADGVDVKIADDGEILVQGPNVMMGYYKDPEDCRSAEGWLVPHRRHRCH